MSTSRPEQSAILGVSMPLALKQRIKRLADLDKRTMASWCAIHLEQLVEELEKPTPAPLMMVAEEPGQAFSPSTPAAGAPPVKYQGGRRSRKN